MTLASEADMETSFANNCFEKEGRMSYEDFKKKADYDIRLMKASKAGKLN
jgi:hypothetical protein